ncbi:MAG TPA: EAL domain-containing protein [Steroidobacteraceae bacterium]|nr:EAL domain-containing protein [Steroidobacteraceae bacterium]
MFQRSMSIQDTITSDNSDVVCQKFIGRSDTRWIRQLAIKLLAQMNRAKMKLDHIVTPLVGTLLSGNRVVGLDWLLFVTSRGSSPSPPRGQFATLEMLSARCGFPDSRCDLAADDSTSAGIATGVTNRVMISESALEAGERAQVTLDSIGDAVVSVDITGHVIYLNATAEKMTGWLQSQAAGRMVNEVLHIVDAITRSSVLSPMLSAIARNEIVRLTSNCLLIHRDGNEAAIEDSAAPIHNRHGNVTGAVMVFRDVSIARAYSSQMFYLARHDSLTGLPNRILFNDRLTQAVALASRQKQKLAVLFLDVDRLKQINDSFGHDMGDRLLQMVAQRLLSCVRSSDTVSRQGGDEFLILLPEVTQSHSAVVTAEKILTALRQPCRIDQHELYVSASIGIATYPEDGAEAETLIKRADFSMYHVKDNGRSNYQFFTEKLNARALQRESLRKDLGYALERNEFALVYQPQLNMESGLITGVEALIRWHHPLRGVISPEQFIPVAEECGAIVSIGQWVMREACYQARSWQKAGLSPLRIAVNVSAIELRAAGFVTAVADILIASGLNPHFLELELTETFLMQDSSPTAAVLHELKALGVQLTLDDFGTGYSSLTHLKRFPIDALKIDQSFVRDVTTDADDASIVGAVISMGNSLHLRVVAEGIETQGQLDFLRTHGCAEGQGMFFSKPVSSGEFTQLLRSSVPAAARRSRIHIYQAKVTDLGSCSSQL